MAATKYRYTTYIKTRAAAEPTVRVQETSYALESSELSRGASKADEEMSRGEHIAHVLQASPIFATELVDRLTASERALTSAIAEARQALELHEQALELHARLINENTNELLIQAMQHGGAQWYRVFSDLLVFTKADIAFVLKNAPPPDLSDFVDYLMTTLDTDIAYHDGQHKYNLEYYSEKVKPILEYVLGDNIPQNYDIALRLYIKVARDLSNHDTFFEVDTYDNSHFLECYIVTSLSEMLLHARKFDVIQTYLHAAELFRQYIDVRHRPLPTNVKPNSDYYGLNSSPSNLFMENLQNLGRRAARETHLKTMLILPDKIPVPAEIVHTIMEFAMLAEEIPQEFYEGLSEVSESGQLM